MSRGSVTAWDLLHAAGRTVASEAELLRLQESLLEGEAALDRVLDLDPAYRAGWQILSALTKLRALEGRLS